MSMQSYGNCELLLNQEKLHKNEKIKNIWIKIKNLIEKIDITDYEIANNCFAADENNKEYELLKKTITEYINTVWKEAKIDIYPTYIDSEAEGTDHAGELIWCIEPELTNKVKEFSNSWTSWSTFG